MKTFAIVGLCYGDEGKGLVTDYLVSKFRNPLVVRFSGGHQCTHTVCHENISHVFASFGSGTLQGASTLITDACLIDPVALNNEFIVLVKKIGIPPRPYIHKYCMVTTPYDIAYNRSKKNIHGTCGVGISATKQREEDNYHLRFEDLFHPTALKIKLDLIKDYYYTLVEKEHNLRLDDYLEILRYKNQKMNIGEFLACAEWLTQFAILIPPNPINKFTPIIFEGSQGLLLDQEIGFFPYVTRSHTGTIDIIRYRPYVYLVTRAYQTRHGEGPMTNEHIPNNIKDNPDETNKENEYQGKFRKSLLDLDLLLYAISQDEYISKTKNRALVITCLDHIVNEYRFTFQSKIVCCDTEKDFIEKISRILKIPDVYISKSPYSKNIQKAL
jgi:adenylosuccinate synthase